MDIHMNPIQEHDTNITSLKKPVTQTHTWVTIYDNDDGTTRVKLKDCVESYKTSRVWASNQAGENDFAISDQIM